jgi:hypothetical protein
MKCICIAKAIASKAPTSKQNYSKRISYPHTEGSAESSLFIHMPLLHPHVRAGRLLGKVQEHAERSPAVDKVGGGAPAMALIQSATFFVFFHHQ